MCCRFCVCVWMIVYYAIQSSIQVAWLAIRPSPPPVTGVLRYQLGIKSDLVLTLCIDVLNLIPGTMVLEIRPEPTHRLRPRARRRLAESRQRVLPLGGGHRGGCSSRRSKRDSDWQPSPWHQRDYEFDAPRQEDQP